MLFIRQTNDKTRFSSCKRLSPLCSIWCGRSLVLFLFLSLSLYLCLFFVENSLRFHFPYIHKPINSYSHSHARTLWSPRLYNSQKSWIALFFHCNRYHCFFKQSALYSLFVYSFLLLFFFGSIDFYCLATALLVLSLAFVISCHLICS